VLIGLIALEAIVVIGILARYVFGYPVPFADEYSGYLMAIVVMLPLSWVLKRAQHVRIDDLIKIFPARVVRYVDLINIFVSLAVVVILTIGTGKLVIASFTKWIRAWSPMETPLGPVQLVLPIGLGLFAIQIIVEIVRMIGGRRPTNGMNDRK
jgi:TRAP-type C4-dicarboxylate transport system permease small subunit